MRILFVMCDLHVRCGKYECVCMYACMPARKHVRKNLHAYACMCVVCTNACMNACSECVYAVCMYSCVCSVYVHACHACMHADGQRQHHTGHARELHASRFRLKFPLELDQRVHAILLAEDQVWHRSLRLHRLDHRTHVAAYGHERIRSRPRCACLRGPR